MESQAAVEPKMASRAASAVASLPCRKSLKTCNATHGDSSIGDDTLPLPFPRLDLRFREPPSGDPKFNEKSAANEDSMDDAIASATSSVDPQRQSTARCGEMLVEIDSCPDAVDSLSNKYV